MNKLGNNVDISVSSKDDNIDKNIIIDEINSFAEKNYDILKNSHINVNCNTHKEKTRNTKSVYCRTNIVTPTKRININRQGFGEHNTMKSILKTAAEKIHDVRINKVKKIELD